MRSLTALGFLLLVSLPVLPVQAAGKIYKSIDEQGNVIYSEKPLPGAEQSKAISVPPPPSPEDVRRAEEETRRIKERADAMEAERKGRELGVARDQGFPAPAAETRSDTIDPASATGLAGHPRLDPEELEKYLKNPSYIPKLPDPPVPTPSPR